ncbi:MAG: urease accessory protein, partial [Bacteroidota bacterium]|nr:urease accessory protein [Bacteroidota bacterium]
HLLAFGVGLIHGLAGSGALVLVSMAQIRSPFQGLIYLLIFGLGCVAGMAVAAGFLSVPYSRKIVSSQSLHKSLVFLTSILCVGYGFKLIWTNL